MGKRIKISQDENLVHFTLNKNGIKYSTSIADWKQYEAKQALIESGASQELVDRLVDAVRNCVIDEERQSD